MSLARPGRVATGSIEVVLAMTGTVTVAAFGAGTAGAGTGAAVASTGAAVTASSTAADAGDATRAGGADGMGAGSMASAVVEAAGTAVRVT
ncbi:MAG: hypothetical protein ACXWIQ_18425, partial [Caldimonas sp.]